VQVFKAIHEAIRDKAADKLCAHLLASGIQAELLHEHPLQKVGAKRGKSLGLVQVTGKNIGYVNLIKRSEYSLLAGRALEEYYLEYLVPLRDIPSSLCWAALRTRTRSLLSREVVDIEWGGGSLADTLNGDLALKQRLLTEFRLNRPLGIEIAPEPVYRCIRIETDHRLPSGRLFDCLDRVAGHIP